MGPLPRENDFMIQVKKPSGRFILAEGFAPFQQNSRKKKRRVERNLGRELGVIQNLVFSEWGKKNKVKESFK